MASSHQDGARFDVTVIVCTYNSAIDKLFFTLSSILRQVDVAFQIIIADDGSKVFAKDDVISFFKRHSFVDYSFSLLEKNMGTVSNIWHASREAFGDYIKAIGAGDALFDRQTLSMWVNAMRIHKAEVSFGDAVCFTGENEYRIVSMPNSPHVLARYDRKQNNRFKANYLLCCDFILGATLCLERKRFLEYIDLLNGNVKYEEDMMAAIAVYDGVPIFHYPAHVVWYECNTGISTAKVRKWAALLNADTNACFSLLSERPSPNDFFYRRLKRCLKKRSFANFLLFPSMILDKLRNKLFSARTPMKADSSFLSSLLSD